jgi:hypothetical protein
VESQAQTERALDTGLKPARATGDEIHGRGGELRELFEGPRQPAA